MRVTNFCYNQAKFQPGSCGCQVSYGTLISTILIYNSKTRNRIFKKFSASKRSSMEKMSAKFRRPEIVAVATITDSFFLFNARHLNWGRSIVFKFWEFVLQDQRYILCLEHNFLWFCVIIKQNLSQDLWMHGSKQCFLPDKFYSTACTGNGTGARPFCMSCYLAKFPFKRSRVWLWDRSVVTRGFLHVLLAWKIPFDNVESFVWDTTFTYFHS